MSVVEPNAMIVVEKVTLTDGPLPCDDCQRARTGRVLWSIRANDSELLICRYCIRRVIRRIIFAVFGDSPSTSILHKSP